MSPVLALIVKTPSWVAEAPTVVPLIVIVAKGIGDPASSVTLPVITLVCEKARREHNINPVKIKVFLMCVRIYV
jgi:hypothetical protein